MCLWMRSVCVCANRPIPYPPTAQYPIKNTGQHASYVPLSRFVLSGYRQACNLIKQASPALAPPLLSLTLSICPPPSDQPPAPPSPLAHYALLPSRIPTNSTACLVTELLLPSGPNSPSGDAASRGATPKSQTLLSHSLHQTLNPQPFSGRGARGEGFCQEEDQVEWIPPLGKARRAGRGVLRGGDGTTKKQNRKRVCLLHAHQRFEVLRKSMHLHLDREPAS